MSVDHQILPLFWVKLKDFTCCFLNNLCSWQDFYATTGPSGPAKYHLWNTYNFLKQIWYFIAKFILLLQFKFFSFQIFWALQQTLLLCSILFCLVLLCFIFVYFIIFHFILDYFILLYFMQSCLILFQCILQYFMLHGSILSCAIVLYCILFDLIFLCCSIYIRLVFF